MTRALRDHGIETVRCDLLNEAEVEKLPDAANVVYMPARKFGSTGDEATTWAVNCYLPAIVCKKYRQSRFVAFSTGNVYPLSPVSSGGPRETDPPNPVGEYGMSALGRERMFEYFSRTRGIPVAIIRLNYAVDLRYGVLVDLARKVHAGEPVDLAMGYFNAIWQGDANAHDAAGVRPLFDAAAGVQRDRPGDAERADGVRAVRRAASASRRGSPAPRRTRRC